MRLLLQPSSTQQQHLRPPTWPRLRHWRHHRPLPGIRLRLRLRLLLRRGLMPSRSPQRHRCPSHLPRCSSGRNRCLLPRHQPRHRFLLRCPSPSFLRQRQHPRPCSRLRNRLRPPRCWHLRPRLRLLRRLQRLRCSSRRLSRRRWRPRHLRPRSIRLRRCRRHRSDLRRRLSLRPSLQLLLSHPRGSCPPRVHLGPRPSRSKLTCRCRSLLSSLRRPLHPPRHHRCGQGWARRVPPRRR